MYIEDLYMFICTYAIVYVCMYIRTGICIQVSHVYMRMCVDDTHTHTHTHTHHHHHQRAAGPRVSGVAFEGRTTNQVCVLLLIWHAPCALTSTPGMYPPPHMTCMYPPPHVTCMYPPHMTCMYPPPHVTCLLRI
jgi:UDP-N-acetylmuramyl pentapeptide phosphotransferase/UDP-N-acetylglucosamine-1-phosphate transferase